MRTRFTRTKRRKIGDWPETADSPEALAEQVRYLGSPEHKSHPSPVGPPRLRSDATPCEVERTRDVGGNTEALREGIRRGCVSGVFEGGFPKYVWTWIGDELYEARHINGPRGTCKGYRLEKVDRPVDPKGRLEWKA